MRRLVLLLTTACAVTRPLSPGPVTDDVRAVQDRVDWQAAREEATSVLSRYLQVDTRNPPGNELDGARFLAAELALDGIDSELVVLDGNRGSLVARLAGRGDAPALCLLSHIDVVGADPERWPHPPLSGHVDDAGRIWGRGALDMKGPAVVELQAMRLIARLGVPLSRDVVLLAVADEEQHNQGMRQLVAERWSALGCGHVVNEGGLGLEDALFHGQTVFGISVAEKGNLWLRVTVHGEGGHGSVTTPNRAPAKLGRALDRLARRKPRPEVHPALYETFAAAGAHHRGLAAFVLRRPALVRALAVPRLLHDPTTASLVTDTVQVTGFGGADAPNVVPAEVWFTIDARLLPGHDPEALRSEIEALLGDDLGLDVEVIASSPAYTSEWHDDPVFAALVRHAVDGRPDAVAGPIVMPGSTDSAYARAIGTRAYGFTPFSLTEAQALTMHGDGEHLSSDALVDAVRRMLGILVDVAAVR